MHFSWVSVLFLASVCLGSAIPENGSLTARDSGAEPKEAADAAAMKDKKVEDKSEDSDCFGPPLCCTSLATPLDPLVDALLDDLDVDVASIVRSIGLLCEPYERDSCDTAPQCCTEANLLGGTVALGCSALKE